MDIFWLLISNLVILSIFLLLCSFFTSYDLRWWLKVQRTKYIYENFYKKFILLEIKMPREITRSPVAMELVLDGFIQGAGMVKPMPKVSYKLKDFFSSRESLRAWWSDTYLKGEVVMWHSLEIESRGGEIHFYIATQQKFKEYFSSLIYSQYPGIEVTEAEDYTTKIRPENQGGEHSVFTAYVEPDGSKKDYLPIKTYIDYGLDKDPKDEHKVDPLVTFLETMANIKPDEHFWVQIMIRTTINDKWKKDGQDRMDKIMGIKRWDKKSIEADAKEHGGHSSYKEGDIKEQSREVTKLPPKEKDELDLIHRNLSKPGFDCHIKTIYIAPKGKLRPEADQIVRNAFRSFNSENYNKFKMKNQNSTQPWHDFADRRNEKRSRGVWFFLYAMRNGYYKELDTDSTPLKDLIARYKGYGFTQAKAKFYGDFLTYFTDVGNVYTNAEGNGGQFIGFVLNSEELATIYHFPSRAFAAPKFGRVESVKSEPPTNLPF